MGPSPIYSDKLRYLVKLIIDFFKSQKSKPKNDRYATKRKVKSFLQNYIKKTKKKKTRGYD